MTSEQWETVPVDKVAFVHVAPNGALTVGLLLKGGRQIALGFSSEERGKLLDGLLRTKTALSGEMSVGQAAEVTGFDVHTDALGQVVLVMPRAGDIRLDRLAIEPGLAQNLVEALTVKIDELRQLNRHLRSRST